MGTFEYFEHTADVGLRVRAVELPELFRCAADGLMGFIVANAAEIRAREPECFTLEAEDAASLLLSWLNELIFRSETGHRVYSRFQVRIDETGRHLEATIWGEAIDADRHVLDHEVKAATRHGSSILRATEAEWVAEVILDI